MLKFNKALKLKIISIAISISCLFTNTLYAFPSSKDSLRAPINQRDTYRRIIEARKASKKRAILSRRSFLKRAAGASVVAASLIKNPAKLLSSSKAAIQSVVSQYAYLIPMGRAFNAKTLSGVNDTPYYPSSPLLGFGSGTISPGSNGAITRNHMDAGVHKYDPSGQPLFYMQTDLSQEPKALNKGEFWTLYPKSGYVFDTGPETAKLEVTQFSPIIPHDYRATSLPVGIFRLSISNIKENPQSVTVHVPFKNFARLVGWEDADIDVKPQVVNGKVVGVVLSNKSWDNKGWKGQIALASSSLSNVQIEASGKLNGTIAITASLGSLQSMDIPLVLAMDFPNAVLPGGQVIPRYYTKFFGDSGKSAWGLAQEGVKQAANWESSIDKFQKSIIENPKIPEPARRMFFNELAYIADAGSLWDANTNRFAYLETYDYPYYNTSDVYFYGGMMLLKFWPDLSKNILRQFAEGILYADPTPIRYDNPFPTEFVGPRKLFGAAIHDVGSPYAGIGSDKVNAYVFQNCNHWKDLNSKFVLMAYLNYYLTGSNDGKFLEDMWPAVKAALTYERDRMQKEGRNLPIHQGFPDQTYDTFPLKGASPYTGGLWIAALEAAIKMADILGCAKEAGEYRSWLTNAKKEFEERLWEEDIGYYKLDEYTQGVIFADQMVGAWYAELLNLDPIVPEDHLKKALGAVYRYNFLKFENGKRGIVNAIYEDGRVFDTPQGKEFWVGANHPIADLMRKGMMSEATNIWQSVETTLLEFGVMGRTPEAYEANGVTRAHMYMRSGSIAALVIDAPEPSQPTDAALLKDDLSGYLPTISILKPGSRREDFWPETYATWVRDSGNELDLEVIQNPLNSGEKALRINFKHNNDAWIGFGSVGGTTDAEIKYPYKMALRFGINGNLGTSNLVIIFEDQSEKQQIEVGLGELNVKVSANQQEVEIPLGQIMSRNKDFNWGRFKQVKGEIRGIGQGQFTISGLRIEPLQIRTGVDVIRARKDEPTFSDIELVQNYPNPFNAETNIVYTIKNHPSAVELKIYDIRGGLIKDFSREAMANGSGTHSLIWDGVDSRGYKVPSGVYILRLVVTDANGHISRKSKKMIYEPLGKPLSRAEFLGLFGISKIRTNL